MLNKNLLWDILLQFDPQHFRELQKLGVLFQVADLDVLFGLSVVAKTVIADFYGRHFIFGTSRFEEFHTLVRDLATFLVGGLHTVLLGLDGVNHGSLVEETLDVLTEYI